VTTIAYVHHKELIDKDTKIANNQAGYRLLARYLSQALDTYFDGIEYVAPLRNMPSPLGAARMAYKKMTGDKGYFDWSEPSLCRNYARQAEKKIARTKADVVLCMESKHGAYLRCPQPIIYWPDSLYMGMVDFYGWGKNVGKTTRDHLIQLDKLAVANASILAFPSQWAADFTIKTYGADPAKVKVIPWGANEECDRTAEDIKAAVVKKSRDKCVLLFVGVEFERKGGNRIIEIAADLNRKGLPTELIILGAQLKDKDLPDFVRVEGFIDKRTPQGKERIQQLHAESHFLLMLSQAETYGLVFCEANSYGVPCIGSDVGGIPTLIQDGKNGKTFPLDSPLETYTDYIMGLHADAERYAVLAESSFAEYQNRLSWDAAAKTLRACADQVLKGR
jgi:glycosyltransferase involved in cell wall biosynthesis